MHSLRSKLFAVLLVSCFLVSLANAAISVRVYSKDEALTENQMSKPRIIIENIGDETVSDFHYYYIFYVENGKVPELEDYYTPQANVSLENMGGNEYRLKYDFTGINLEPGQTLPNQDGNSVGLRYTDWSHWDKTNDISNNQCSDFRLNGSIPVFLSDGTQIYGNELPDPQNPPQPPALNYSLDSYAIYTQEFSDIRDRATIKGGAVGSATYTEVGCDAIVEGNVYSGGYAFLRERATIRGDAAAVEQIIMQNSVTVDGDQRNYAKITFPTIGDVQVTYGTDDIPVDVGADVSIAPGQYRDLYAFSNATVRIAPGEYGFRSFRLEPDVNIIFQAGEGERTVIRVNDDIQFADRVIMGFENDITPMAVQFYSSQNGQLRIGTDALIYGWLSAPAADVVISPRASLYGKIEAKRAVVEPDAIVCMPPLLSDVWHSEWAYAPAFNPLVFEYAAVVPDATTTLTVTPDASGNATVLVNGEDPSTPVNLSATETDIIISLTDPNNCGKSDYSLNVARSNQYQIFVDDDSECIPGNEDGNSWETAYKDLQDALDRAAVEGKEIWIAEGVYRPTFRTNPEDPRSATFNINPGIEIKGGYRGTEIEDEPLGSLFRTILTGDLMGNDQNAGGDTRLEDNVYHVITIRGQGKKGIKVARITIKDGIADGGDQHNNGGGILNSGCAPNLEYVAIKDNYAESFGAGLFSKGGVTIKNCLFTNNNAKISGAAAMITDGSAKITASVFDQNVISEGLHDNGGAALYTGNCKTEIVNSVFCNNSSVTDGGAIFNSKSALDIINCTFANNESDSGCAGITNTGGNVDILNTILWNQHNTSDFSELKGAGIISAYSCIQQSDPDQYPGEGNIYINPEFKRLGTPEGVDGVFGNYDDGLLLKDTSPCRGSGTGEGAPNVDILLTERDRAGTVDIGAYSYVNFNNDGIIGKFVNGNFQPTLIFDVVDRIGNSIDILEAMESEYSHVIEIVLPKNKYTNKKNQVVVQIRGLDGNGNIIGDYVNVTLYRVDNSQVFRSFIGTNTVRHGKPIIFTKDIEGGHPGGEHLLAYLVRASELGKVRITLRHNQF